MYTPRNVRGGKGDGDNKLPILMNISACLIRSCTRLCKTRNSAGQVRIIPTFLASWVSVEEDILARRLLTHMLFFSFFLPRSI